MVDHPAALEYLLREAGAAARVETEILEGLVEALEPARRVFVYGRGRSGFVARSFAVRLMHLGYSVFVVGETITAPVAKDDVVICVSGSGSTYPVVMTAELGRRLGATVIAVTRDTESQVARLAHHVVPIATKIVADEDKKRFAPLGTLFELSTQIFFDALVAVLMERLGQTETALQRRHATLE